jgi:hypothetical protein
MYYRENYRGEEGRMSKFGEPLSWSAEAVCEYEARVFSIESKKAVCSITCANDNFYIVERMCDCVNALAGIEDPEAFVAEQRARIAELESQNNKMRATLKQAIAFYEAGLDLSETNFREWVKFAEESIKERD